MVLSERDVHRPPIAVGQVSRNAADVVPSRFPTAMARVRAVSLAHGHRRHLTEADRVGRAQALIMWMADLLLALSKLPRSVLPSIAITWPSVASWTAWIQLSRHRSNSARDSIEKIALNRSCDGIPRPQVEDLSKPSPLLPTEVGDRHEIVGPANHATDRYDDEVDERMRDLPTAGIGKRREMNLNPGTG